MRRSGAALVPQVYSLLELLGGSSVRPLAARTLRRSPVAATAACLETWRGHL